MSVSRSPAGFGASDMGCTGRVHEIANVDPVDIPGVARQRCSANYLVGCICVVSRSIAAATSCHCDSQLR